ncbi:MAG: multiple sugar transport system ATP-binding protein, partial [Candidatus Latescibacterota bacterium]
KISLPERYTEKLDNYRGKEIVFGIRPEDIHDPDTIGRDVETVEIEAKVEVVEPMGNEVFLNLTSGKSTFVARVDPLNMPKVEQIVKLAVEVDKAHFFDVDNQSSLL